MPTKAAEDVDAIYDAIMRLKLQRYGCKVRRGEPASECWCYRAGPQGTVLPCPPPETSGDARDETAIYLIRSFGVC